MDSKQSKIDTMIEKLKGFNELVEKLQAKAREGGAAVGESIEKEISEVKTKIDAARKKIDEMTETTNEVFDDLYTAFSSAAGEIKQSLDRILGGQKK